MFKKNNPFIQLTLIFSILILCGSCRDIIEKDISEDTPTLILPSVNDTIQTNPVHVKWDALDGATKYRVEIVSPNFSAIQEFVVDSIVSGTNFYTDLDSNEYQIRLTALNAGYESQTTAPRTFWVGTSTGSSNGTVVLDEPSSGAYVNESFDGSFSWFAVSGASSYTFELHKDSTFAGELLDYANQLVTAGISSYNGTQLEDGRKYCWGVKAFLANGETNYTKRIFYVDTINPSLASLSTPATNANIASGSIDFTWQVPTDIGNIQSPLISVLQISTTSGFTSLLTPKNVSGNSTNYELTTGTYYWRIRMKDEAGNLGPVPTTYRTLNVTP